MRPHLVSWLEGLVPGGVASALAPTWFTCVGLAGLVTLFLMLAIARRHQIDSGVIASIVLWCYVAAVAAGIVVPMAIDAVEQLFTTGRIHLRWAGMTSFWGYLAGVAAVAAVCRAHHLPLARLGDLASAPLGVALVLSRLGCFVAGCDFGKVTSVPWAVRFPSGSPAWHAHVGAGLVAADRAESLPVHPTQLYEAALGVLIAVVALWAARRRWARGGHGRVFLIAAVVYAIGRILIEDLRGDTGRGIYFGLASGQIFSLLLLAAIAGGLFMRRARLATMVAAAAIALAVVEPSAAGAEPQPRGPAASGRATPQPPPAPAPPAAPQPGPSPRPQPPAGQPAQPFGPAPPPAYQPVQPLPPQPAQPLPPPPPYDPQARPTASSGASASTSAVQVGALLGLAMPLNRRPEQVASLAGPSLSIGLALRNVNLWLDLDSFGNRDASHGTVLLSGSMMTPVANNLQVGGRIGIGATLVNFDDPAFRDVAGTTVRIDAVAEYALNGSWAMWIRPLSFDVLSAADLGGPIMTWQTRIGLGYRFPVGRRAAAGPAPTPAPAAPGMYPTSAPPVPGAYPQPPPAAGPYPPPASGPYPPPASGPYPPPTSGPYPPPASGPYPPPASGPYPQPPPASGPYPQPPPASTPSQPARPQQPPAPAPAPRSR